MRAHEGDTSLVLHQKDGVMIQPHYGVRRCRCQEKTISSYHFVSCSRHQAIMSSIDIFDLSTFADAFAAGSGFSTDADAGAASTASAGAAGAASAVFATVGAELGVPPARAAAIISATLIFERSTLDASGAAALGAPAAAAGFAPGAPPGLPPRAAARISATEGLPAGFAAAGPPSGFLAAGATALA